MVENEHLLACPFCCTNYSLEMLSHIHNYKGYQVWCSYCGAMGPKESNAKNAVKRWNSFERSEKCNRELTMSEKKKRV
jgi:Lar family restriction alleviation protein